MQGDFTRSPYRPEKHYSSVRQQQGRVWLDSDWNEQVEIQAHLEQTETCDVIGCCGVPKAKDDGGFELKPITTASGPPDLLISPGRIYVHGMLCELLAGTDVVVTRFKETPDQQHVDVEVQTLTVDARPFEKGQWVEFFQGDKLLGTARIASIDIEKRVLELEWSAPSGGHLPSDNLRLRRLMSVGTQPDGPVQMPPKGSGGKYLLSTHYIAYLDVWQRHVSAVEDPDIREVALGGPDTTTRTRTVAQVKLHPVQADNPDVTTLCDQYGCDWKPPGKDSTARLCARADPDLTGYRRLENQLYRVEIHRGGRAGEATFKWSRDNGSAIYPVESIDVGQDSVTLAQPGRDKYSSLQQGDWVELVDDEKTLAGDIEPLLQVYPVNENGTLVQFKTGSLQGVTCCQDAATHRFLRRWDQRATAGTTPEEGAIPVEEGDWRQLDEEGVQIWFEKDGIYQSGDYWTIPARAAINDTTGDVLWPRDGDEPRFEKRHGIEHYYCPLAVIQCTDNKGVVEIIHVDDCRNHFPALTDIQATDVAYQDSECGLSDVARSPVTNVQQAINALCAREHNYLTLRYVSGDGQAGPPGAPLPVPLVVAVENALGEPQEGVEVKFDVELGQGSVDSSPPSTDSKGEAKVTWRLGKAEGVNTVRAYLKTPQRSETQIIFNARAVREAEPAAEGGLCTITVGDGSISHGQYEGPEGLRQALGLVSQKGFGGTVCVLRGNYDLGQDPLVVRGSEKTSITVQGNWRETNIYSSGPALQFETVGAVKLHNLRITATGLSDRPGLVTFEGCGSVVVRECQISASGDQTHGVAGVLIRESGRPISSELPTICVEECQINATVKGAFTGISLPQTSGAHIAHNRVYILAGGGSCGIDLVEGCTDCVIADNTIVGRSITEEVRPLDGIHVGNGCDHTVVRDNLIDGGQGYGIVLGNRGGDDLPGVTIEALRIERNHIRRMALNGILASPTLQTDNLLIQGNRIESCGSKGQLVAVQLDVMPIDQDVEVAILDNSVDKPQGSALWVAQQGSGAIRVNDNHFEGQTNTPPVVFVKTNGVVQFNGNHVVSHLANGVKHLSPIVHIVSLHATVSANHCVCLDRLPTVAHMGIEVGETGSATATGNHCLEINRKQNDGQPWSIFLRGPQRSLAAVGNVTTNGVELSPDNPGAEVANLTGVLAP